MLIDVRVSELLTENINSISFGIITGTLLIFFVNKSILFKPSLDKCSLFNTKLCILHQFLKGRDLLFLIYVYLNIV